ncbi:hypothetical protein EMIHUDRAFT_70806 [Emiliania huxleyi CCMP1516]|uniref:CobW C-terminal domain-containing protein n=2 Tax=Emiliania huxleyi TaxID=2903 RepID=A0A0D3KKL1_EMIH1|nr:hypothetical protein EMIHUDRAFT_70806 [Emiliania huxleyi CCMP1516]EOD36296.1 hypothetical protein EMIHUDRAFT_70806 [Emiliania huxleyi CCMP1516]|eukprot:XP_005788725.1 hypothetical protein EMIHUDRAFT_70806 [Emiliania huxleyi CCMP1516]
MASESSSVPVSILTGFLGAGKTTLLRHLLTEKHGLRIAVIQNELSATSGLEASTMQGPGGETFDRWMELANGCVCCEVRDELPFALERLMEATNTLDGRYVRPTVGMADPGPVAASLWLDDALESPLELDGVITLVDARRCAAEAVCRRGLSLRPALVQTRTRLHDTVLSAALPLQAGVDLDRLCARLRAINAVAPQLRASHSQLPVASILNRRAYAREGPPPLDAEDAPAYSDQRSRGHVYRAKGELAVADEEVGGVVARYTLQAVHETWELERGRPWGEEEVAESRLVFIGRNLDEATLRAMLLACVACETERRS